MLRVALREPLMSLQVRDVLALEVLHRLRHCIQHLDEGAHLGLRRVQDGVERALDEIGDERRKGDSAQCGTGDRSHLACRRRFEAGHGAGEEPGFFPFFAGTQCFLGLHEGTLTEDLGQSPVVQREGRGVRCDPGDPICQCGAVSTRHLRGGGSGGHERLDLRLNQLSELGCVGRSVWRWRSGVRCRQCRRQPGHAQPPPLPPDPPPPPPHGT